MKSEKQIKAQEKLTISVIYSLQNASIGLMPESEEWKVLDNKKREAHAQLSLLQWILGNKAEKDV